MSSVGNPPWPLPSRIETSSESVIGDGQVEHAVAREVARHDRRRVRPRWIKDGAWNVPSPLPRRIETPCSVAVAVSTISDGHVEAAVAVEIAHHQAGRARLPPGTTPRPGRSRRRCP